MSSYIDKIRNKSITIQKKQPLYFLVDTSASMDEQDKIAKVNSAIARMLKSISNNTSLRDIAHISFITFDDKAKVVIPLTHIDKIEVKKFAAGGQTALGSALVKLTEEIQKNSEGFYTPAVFLLTDGWATDDLPAGVTKLESIDFKGQFFNISIGQDADIETLKRISEHTYEMEKMTKNDFDELFSWFVKVVEIITLRDSKLQLSSKGGYALAGSKSVALLTSTRTNQVSLGSSGQLMLPPPPKNIKKA